VSLCGGSSVYFRDCMVCCVNLGCLSLEYVYVCILLGMWVVCACTSNPVLLYMIL